MAGVTPGAAALSAASVPALSVSDMNGAYALLRAVPTVLDVVSRAALRRLVSRNLREPFLLFFIEAPPPGPAWHFCPASSKRTKGAGVLGAG